VVGLETLYLTDTPIGTFDPLLAVRTAGSRRAPIQPKHWGARLVDLCARPSHA
jgi:hypothetical protein